jgi:hypothetical protein
MAAEQGACKDRERDREFARARTRHTNTNSCEASLFQQRARVFLALFCSADRRREADRPAWGHQD